MGNRVIVITGVCGCGKTTVGLALAERLNIRFYDGDRFHPEANIEKMAAGIPLTDLDRQPWLSAINAFIKERLPHETLIIACSALREKYRMELSTSIDPAAVSWIHLQGSYDVIYHRMLERKDHFMSAEMLRSQFDVYEHPKSGMMVNIDQHIDQIIENIVSGLALNKTDIGLIGLGVMGTSLARNIARNGFTISIFNRHVDGTEEGVAKKIKSLYPELQASQPFDNLEQFVTSLSAPRKILLMVNAGQPVDDIIRQLTPMLKAGDVIVDCGNTHFKDTERRQNELQKKNIHFVGAGISGGEEGALNGPSIMPGGSMQGFALIEDVLMAIAARNTSGEVCCDHIGDGGSGHFVKMVHNGIEYAEMQLIAEVYSHLRYNQQMAPVDIAAIFDEWNRGETGSYLLDITKNILRFNDTDGKPLIDKISDVAGNKGTGSWTTMTACEVGVPVPAMAEALFARYVSSFKADRDMYTKHYPQDKSSISIGTENLRLTFMFCRLMNHCQGIKLIGQASAIFGWNIDAAVLLKIWSGGCIIRSNLLSILRDGWAEHQDVMMHPYTINLANAHLREIKATVSQLALSSLAFPVISSCLDYYKSMVTRRGNTYLIQAQRDYFGAHTYRRIDGNPEVSHHTKWM